MEPADNVTFRISCRLQIRRLGGSMRKVSIVAPLLCYAVLVMLVQVSLAKAAQKGAAGAGTLSGSWLVTADFTGVPFYYRLELKQDGDKLTGDFGGDKLEGTLSGNAIHFVAKDEHSGTDELRGTVQGTTMSGLWCSPIPATPRTRKRILLPRNSCRSGGRERRSATNSHQQLFTGNSRR